MTTKTGFGFYPPADGCRTILRDLHAAMDSGRDTVNLPLTPREAHTLARIADVAMREISVCSGKSPLTAAQRRHLAAVLEKLRAA
jgi:hypothetical protein